MVLRRIQDGMDAARDADPGVLQPEKCPIQGSGRVHPSVGQESSGNLDKDEAS